LSLRQVSSPTTVEPLAYSTRLRRRLIINPSMPEACRSEFNPPPAADWLGRTNSTNHVPPSPLGGRITDLSRVHTIDCTYYPPATCTHCIASLACVGSCGKSRNMVHQFVDSFESAHATMVSSELGRSHNRVSVLSLIRSEELILLLIRPEDTLL
jgi:hypothetical protein